jgi:hypothetical protein
MLASLLGLGWFLATGLAQAQTWTPANSPYGAWRSNAMNDGSSTTTWKNANPSSYPVVPSPGYTPHQDMTSPAVIPVEQAAAPAKSAPSQPKLAVQPVRYAQPGMGLGYDARTAEEAFSITIQLEPPGRERLFQLESEAAMNERMRQEGLTNPRRERIIFPDEPVVSADPYPGRHWPMMSEFVEPAYVCHGRLLLEQKNFERYGWDLGIVAPVVSAGAFFVDMAMLPYNLATAPCRCYECSAGQCLPGDPVPMLLYPPELSATGAVAETGVILGLLAIFP